MTIEIILGLVIGITFPLVVFGMGYLIRWIDELIINYKVYHRK